MVWLLLENLRSTGSFRSKELSGRRLNQIWAESLQKIGRNKLWSMSSFVFSRDDFTYTNQRQRSHNAHTVRFHFNQ